MWIALFTEEVKICCRGNFFVNGWYRQTQSNISWTIMSSYSQHDSSIFIHSSCKEEWTRVVKL
jgi:hypothetical protein